MSEDRYEEEVRDDLMTAEEAVEDAHQEEEPDHGIQEEPERQEQDEENEVEQKAKKYGHLSKEDWIAQGKDPDQWKSPEEFNRTGEILDQLYSMKKQLDKRDREIQALVDYQQRTSEREYERAKQELEQKLTMAKEDMDMEAVSHYTKELSRVEDMEQQNKQQSIQEAHQAALSRFTERNKHWFNEQNPDLMTRAQVIDQELKSIYPNATFDELAQKIEMRMQYEYPDRVGGQAKPKQTVSHSQSSVNKSAGTHRSSEMSFRKLPQELKDTYSATKRIIESQSGKEYSVKDFMEQLKRDGEI